MKNMIFTICLICLSANLFGYYNPEQGRWTSRDPIEEKGGLNLYCMVGNNSIDAWDYLGRDSGAPGAYNPDGSGYGIGPHTDGGTNTTVSITFLMGTHEFVFQDECKFYCISWAPTELFGVGVGTSAGNQTIPVTVGYGLGKYNSVATSLTHVETTAGVGLQAVPTGVSVSVRLTCFALTKTGKNGCPCKEIEPVSVVGQMIN